LGGDGRGRGSRRDLEGPRTCCPHRRLLRACRERPATAASPSSVMKPRLSTADRFRASDRIAHLRTAGDCCAAKFNSAYDSCGSRPVIQRCRLNVRFDRKRTRLDDFRVHALVNPWFDSSVIATVEPTPVYCLVLYTFADVPLNAGRLVVSQVASTVPQEHQRRS